MFLRTLNKQQKRLFLSLANAAAAANNVVEESEKVFIEKMAAIFNLLETRTAKADSRSTTRGTKHCSACKRNVQYAICGADVHTNYV